MPQPIPEDLPAYFDERAPFLRMVAIKDPDDQWGIYLRIDGAYATEPTARQVRGHADRFINAIRHTLRRKS